MILKQGKFKGWHIKEVPSYYLEWLVQSYQDDETREEARREFDRRTITTSHYKFNKED